MACIASQAESWRVRPPGTTESGARRVIEDSVRRVRSTWDSGAATTIAVTAGWRGEGPALIAPDGARRVLAQLFRGAAPQRAPPPPPGMNPPPPPTPPRSALRLPPLATGPLRP